MIEFASVVEKTRLIDPAGHPAEQSIEHRTDPLTGTVASINAALGEKAKAFLGTADVALLGELQEKTKPNCPFCAAAEKGTQFAEGGQLRIGTALAMPNLFSKCASDSVVIVDPSPAGHVLFPSRIRADALADAIRVSSELVRKASLEHHVAGMNFLGPGGSSVPHPHLQVHIRGVPYSGVSRLVRESEAFLQRNGTSYWEALLAGEKQAGARYIGATGSVEWIAAYAPAHQKEILGVLPGVANLGDLSASGAADFAAGIARVISFYEEQGTHPFTFAFLSSPKPSRAFSLHVKLCARPAFRPMYANYDTWFTPKLVGDEVHTEAPESYARRIAAAW